VQADIVFLLDSTNSAGMHNYHTMSSFMASLVNDFDIGPSAVRVGAVIYRNHAHTQFELNQYNTKGDIIHAIPDMDYNNDPHIYTYTSRAINYVINHSFQGVYGDRQGVPNILILVTDGVAHSKHDTIAAAHRLHEQNIQTITVGMTYDLSHDEYHNLHDELHAISANNSVYFVHHFDNLQEKHDQILNEICGGKMVPISASLLVLFPFLMFSSHYVYYYLQTIFFYRNSLFL
jgi:hypothetical protein